MTDLTRRKARTAGHTLEEMSVENTLDAIRFADCVIVMLDAAQAFAEALEVEGADEADQRRRAGGRKPVAAEVGGFFD